MSTELKSRILICGGRNFKDYDLFISTMLSLQQWFAKEFVVIQGGASGADRMGMMWAINQGAPMFQVPANWQFYGNRAGTLRNKWMLQFGLPDLVIAFPGGPGTANMVNEAKVWGVDVYEVK
jgi:predicted Rossmann-fold nucleotide-binding protein